MREPIRELYWPLLLLATKQVSKHRMSRKCYKKSKARAADKRQKQARRRAR